MADPHLASAAEGARPDPEVLIRSLLEAMDAYVSGLAGPGIGEVRDGVARYRNHPYTAQIAEPNGVVGTHLSTALAAVARHEPGLAARIAAASPHLCWITYDLYDISEIGEGFAAGHAFCSLLGDAGAIRTDDFDFGLFLIAPHVLYRDHSHPAPELYAPLTGPHGWRFRPGDPLEIKPAHRPVWNEPDVPHLTKVGPLPFLCIYCWTRDNDKPAQVLPAPDWPELEEMRL